MSEPTPDEMLAQAESQIQQALTEEVSDAVDEVEIEDVVEDVDASDDVEDAPEDEVEIEAAAEEEVDPEAAEIEKARKAGWRPKEEYNGPPGKWKDYKEFNAVGEKITSKLTSKIDNLESQNKKQQDMIKKLIQAQGMVAQQAHEEAMAKLKAERREAIEMGDADAVDAIDEKIEQTKAKKPDLNVEDEPEPPQIDDAVSSFVEAEKSWFNEKNPDMVKYAIIMEQTERSLGETDSEIIMAKVKQAVATRFPDRLPQAATRRKPARAAVEAGATPVRTKQTVKMSDFPEEVRKIADYFEKNGIMTKADYLKQLKEGMA